MIEFQFKTNGNMKTIGLLGRFLGFYIGFILKLTYLHQLFQ
jgi:hypothetical protein